MNNVDAIIFDLGNVLIEVDEQRAAERFAARTGKTRMEIEAYMRGTPYATELALGKLTKKGFFRTVAKDLAFDGKYEEFASIWSEIFTPIEPMIALAESLKTRVPRLILSNTNAINMDYVFDRFPFLHDFDAHILSHEVGLLKPDLAIYQLALKKHGLTAARTVFIDDLAANVEAARRVGLQAIHFQDVGQAREELTKLGVSPI
jgi:HAD superfamily hydrolase (TIGR01509 family)